MLSIGTALIIRDFWIVGSAINWYIRWYLPIVGAPFILAVLGFRTTERIALIGMLIGILSVFTWRKWIYPILGTDNSSFLCMLLNGSAMLTAHYLFRHSKDAKDSNDAFQQIK